MEWDEAHAVKLHLTEAAMAKYRSLPKGEEHQREYTIARDQISKKLYAIRKHPCWSDSWDCCCAAQAMEVPNRQTTPDWPEIKFLEEEDDS